MPPTNFNRTESKSYGDICSKNHYDISDGVVVQELLSDDSKDFIDNCDIDRVDQVTWTEEMPPTNPDRTESKSHGNNCNKNSHDGDRVGGKE